VAVYRFEKINIGLSSGRYLFLKGRNANSEKPVERPFAFIQGSGAGRQATVTQEPVLCGGCPWMNFPRHLGKMLICRSIK
jgi:hypothetical protein